MCSRYIINCIFKCNHGSWAFLSPPCLFYAGLLVEVLLNDLHLTNSLDQSTLHLLYFSMGMVNPCSQQTTVVHDYQTTVIHGLRDHTVIHRLGDHCDTQTHLCPHQSRCMLTKSWLSLFPNLFIPIVHIIIITQFNCMPYKPIIS